MQSSLLHFDLVCYGEILWGVLPDKSLPGGALMNVAYHLKKMGAHPALISKVGKDAAGGRLMHLLGESGLNTDFVQVDDHYGTGVGNARKKEHNEMEYDIVQPAAWDFIKWLRCRAFIVSKSGVCSAYDVAEINTLMKPYAQGQPLSSILSS